MTRWGEGPLFTLLSVVYGSIILFFHFHYFPDFTFTIFSRWVNLIAGIVLVLIGIPLFIVSGVTVHRHINEGRLCTTGVYSYFRHPLYASWIVFLVPAIVIMIGSIVAISWPVFMYIVFRIKIRGEEEYLEQKFGDEYIRYEKEVNSVLPTILRKRIRKRW